MLLYAKMVSCYHYFSWNFNYCYKITYESGETYDRRRNELSVEISKEDYKKIITGVLQERPIDQIEGISDVIDKMTENVE